MCLAMANSDSWVMPSKTKTQTVTLKLSHPHILTRTPILEDFQTQIEQYCCLLEVQCIKHFVRAPLHKISNSCSKHARAENNNKTAIRKNTQQIPFYS